MRYIRVFKSPYITAEGGAITLISFSESAVVSVISNFQKVRCRFLQCDCQDASQWLGKTIPSVRHLPDTGQFCGDLQLHSFLFC